MRSLIRKRQNIFIKLLHDQAALALEGMDALNKYLSTRDPEAAATLNNKEKEADETRRIFIDELNRIFITPFDRWPRASAEVVFCCRLSSSPMPSSFSLSPSHGGSPSGTRQGLVWAGCI